MSDNFEDEKVNFAIGETEDKGIPLMKPTFPSEDNNELEGQVSLEEFLKRINENEEDDETEISETSDIKPICYKPILNSNRFKEIDEEELETEDEVLEDSNEGNKKKKHSNIWFTLFCIVMVGAIIFLSVFAVTKYKQKQNIIPNVIVYNSPEYNINYKEYNGQVLTAPQIANKCKPSNVAIITYKDEKTLDGTGSGVVMCTDETNTYTYIVTCAHVIDDNEKKTTVKTYDGSVYTAEIIGYDSTTDLGVVRIKANNLQAAEFGNSNNLVSGCTVYAIGNPGGAEYFASMTSGIISDVERPVRTTSGYKYNCIQHDAAVNPGSSGGMLVDEYGQVIGINCQKVTVDSYEGMSFAAPMSIVIPVVSNIVNNYMTAQ